MQNRIEKWAQGKRRLISATAISIASGAEGFYGLTNAIKDREVFDGPFEMPRLEEWLSLYKNHRRVEVKLREAFEMLGGPMTGLVELNDNIDQARAEIRDIDSDFLDPACEKPPTDEIEKIGRKLKGQLDSWAEGQDGHILKWAKITVRPWLICLTKSFHSPRFCSAFLLPCHAGFYTMKRRLYFFEKQGRGIWKQLKIWFGLTPPPFSIKKLPSMFTAYGPEKTYSNIGRS